MLLLFVDDPALSCGFCVGVLGLLANVMLVCFPWLLAPPVFIVYRLYVSGVGGGLLIEENSKDISLRVVYFEKYDGFLTFFSRQVRASPMLLVSTRGRRQCEFDSLVLAHLSM